ncbi:uncharacterized protein METZ01_LOCUS205647, partial [marine metagenome]
MRSKNTFELFNQSIRMAPTQPHF